MNGGNSRKRQAPTPHPSPAQPPKYHASTIEDEEFDEDVFLEDHLIDEDAQILRDIDERQALASRLSKWARPPLSQSYISQSQSIGTILLIIT